MKLRPDFEVAYMNRGVAYCKMGEYGRGIDDFSTAIRLEPNDISAYNNRGNAYNKLGKYELAEKDWGMVRQLSK